MEGPVVYTWVRCPASWAGCGAWLDKTGLWGVCHDLSGLSEELLSKGVELSRERWLSKLSSWNPARIYEWLTWERKLMFCTLSPGHAHLFSQTCQHPLGNLSSIFPPYDHLPRGAGCGVLNWNREKKIVKNASWIRKIRKIIRKTRANKAQAHDVQNCTGLGFLQKFIGYIRIVLAAS